MTDIELEAERLWQQGDQAQKRLAIETMPYENMTEYQKAEAAIRAQEAVTRAKSEESLAQWRQRGNYRPSQQFMTADGHPVSQDVYSGRYIDDQTQQQIADETKLVPITKPGGSQSFAQALVADRERLRASDPSVPPLSLEEATALVHSAPHADQNELRKMSMAQSAWKAWNNDVKNYAARAKGAPESTLEHWNRYYGVRAESTPGASPAAALAPTAARPPRPASVPPEAKLFQKGTAFQWRTPDGRRYSADGTPQ